MTKSHDQKQSFIPCFQRSFPETRISQGFLYINDAICEVTTQCTAPMQQIRAEYVIYKCIQFSGLHNVHLAKYKETFPCHYYGIILCQSFTCQTVFTLHS